MAAVRAKVIQKLNEPGPAKLMEVPVHAVIPSLAQSVRSKPTTPVALRTLRSALPKKWMRKFPVEFANDSLLNVPVYVKRITQTPFFRKAEGWRLFRNVGYGCNESTAPPGLARVIRVFQRWRQRCITKGAPTRKLWDDAVVIFNGEDTLQIEVLVGFT